MIDVTYKYSKYVAGDTIYDTSLTVKQSYYARGDTMFYHSYAPDLRKFGWQYDYNLVIGKPGLIIDTLVDYSSKYNILYGTARLMPSDYSIINITAGWQKRWWNLNFPIANQYVDTTVYDVSLDQYNFNAGWIYSGIKSHILKTGIQVDYTRADYNVFIARFLHQMIAEGTTNFIDFWGPVNGDSTLELSTSELPLHYITELSNRILLHYKGKKNFVNCAWYIHDTWDISRKLSCDAGARVEYSTSDSKGSVSPRLSLKWNISEKNELIGSVGRFTQNNHNISIIALSKNLQPEKVWHGDIGLESKLLSWLTQKLNIYGKYYFDLTTEYVDPSGDIMAYISLYLRTHPEYIDTSDISIKDIFGIWPGLFSTSYRNDGRGYAFGFEYLLRYNPLDFWNGWITFSLGKSQRQRAEGWKWHNFPLERPVLISLNNYYRLPRKYEIGLQFRYMSGVPYTSVETSSNEVIIGEFNNRRYAPYIRLDMRFAKGYSIRKGKGTFYIELWNMTNSPNMFARDSKTNKFATYLINAPTAFVLVGTECKF